MTDLGLLLVVAALLVLAYLTIWGLSRLSDFIERRRGSVNLPLESASQLPPLPRVNQPLTTPTTPVATPSAPDNASLSVVEFSDLDNKVALAVARLIVESERKPFASGKVPEARAIEVVWQCTRSSRDGSTYQDARVLLQQHLAALRGEPEFYDDMIKRIEKEVSAQTVHS